ncbi:MAG: GNAT family N-acetyltransferase [Candidatus Hodarchaeales archaeon]
MKVLIKEAKSWKAFEKAWTNGMQHLYWYNDHKPFEYSKDILKEISSEFSKPKTFFLTAEIDGQLIGALHGYFNKDKAVFGRWEPAIALVDDRDDIGQLLISKALNILLKHKIKTARFISVYSVEKQDQHEWYARLYQNNGFQLKKPAVMQMLLDLKNQKKPPSSSKIKFVGEEKYSLDEFVDFTLKSYNSLAEDKQIHGWDKNVTKPDAIRDMLLKVRNSKLGEYKPEFTVVAELDNEPVGYIFSFIFDPEKKTRRGVIGNLGVFPEHRRNGVALLLLKKMLVILKNNNCQYVQVGTPINNEKAIRTYKKVGFKPDSIIEIYHKAVSH